jgi:copper transport protein
MRIVADALVDRGSLQRETSLPSQTAGARTAPERTVVDKSIPVSHRRVLRRLALLAAALFAVGAASPASAHAELLLASPQPGNGLAQAPAAVVIKFSEPLNLLLSRIEVLDASGTDIGQGSTLPVPGDDRAMQRKLGLLPTGQYTTRWTSVSSLDGHTLRGSYSWAVGSAASGETTVADSPLDSEGPLGLVGRFAALLALGVWLATGLLRRPVRQAGLDPRRVAVVARAAPAVALAGTAVSLISSTVVATGSVTAIGAVVASPSGEARLIVLAASLVGVLVGTRWFPLAIVLAATAILADAASGHAASSAVPPLAIASFAVHLAAVGIWIYAILGSFASAPDLRRALATFTPYAVGAAVATAATGLVNAILEVGDPADLTTTAYGLTILGKSLAFALMAWFGLMHFVWRRRASVDEATLRLPLRAESLAGLLAIVLATLLVGFPNPPREAEAAAGSLTTTDPELSQLAGRDALSIAEASGPFIVGLTILPPCPGPAEVRVQVLGVDAGDGLRNARLVAGTARAAPTESPLTQTCGLGCFAGNAIFATAGDWKLDVQIDSNRGPIEIVESAPLPAVDGSADLARAMDALEALKTAQVTEDIRGTEDGPKVHATYRFQAPDRLQVQVGDSTQVIIGEEQYQKTGTGQWQASSFGAPGFSWPSGYYRQFWRGAVAVRLVGQETVDGVRSDVITFLRPDVPAWFRMWVGISDGLVRREVMRAEGHLMDHAYADLNGPITVQTPPQ